MIFCKRWNTWIIFLRFLLSDVAEKYAEILSASMTFEVGQIASLPIIYRDEEKSNIVNIVKENIKEEENDMGFLWNLLEFYEAPIAS